MKEECDEEECLDKKRERERTVTPEGSCHSPFTWLIFIFPFLSSFVFFSHLCLIHTSLTVPCLLLSACFILSSSLDGAFYSIFLTSLHSSSSFFCCLFGGASSLCLVLLSSASLSSHLHSISHVAFHVSAFLFP